MGKAELEASLSTLDIWLIVFGVLVAIGVVGESVAGFMHWRRSGQLSVVQAAENLSQQREITRLSAEAETARSDIATANAEAAKANERTAEIEKITAWRLLTSENTNDLSAALSEIPKTVPHSVVFAYPPNDMECLYLAAQLGSIFIDLKDWNLERQSRTYPGTLYWGIHILGRDDNELTRAIRNAFTAAKIEFTTEDFPGGFQTYGWMSQPYDTTILVGPKKPPVP